jgi:hypothetical protein
MENHVMLYEEYVKSKNEDANLEHFDLFEMYMNGDGQLNELFGLGSKLSDKEKYERLIAAMPAVWQRQYNDWSSEKKDAFFKFAQDHKYKMPKYFKYDATKNVFVDSTINVGASILAAGSGGKFD